METLTNPPSRKFDAVIFDQDGTLANTMSIIFQAFVSTIHRFSGIEITHDELFNSMGPPEEKILRHYLGDTCFPEAEEYFFSQYNEASNSLDLFTGVAETLEQLKRSGTRLCLFTGMGRRGTKWTFSVLGLGKWIDFKVTGDDVSRFKPDPEGVFKALKAIGVPPEKSLMVGDSPKDIEAGKVAGTKTGIALWGILNESLFDNVHADYRFQSPHQILQAVVPEKFSNLQRSE